MEHLYNDNYLKKTTEFIQELKQASYARLAPKVGDQVLEVGCGNGHDAIALAKLVSPGGKVIGVDVDEPLLIKARENATHQEIYNCTFIQSNAEQLPFEDNQFDLIRAERVFQHLHQPGKVILELYRVLKPGGKLIILETDWPGMNIYISNRELEKKLIESLTIHVLNNGFASRQLLPFFIEHGFLNSKLNVYPFILENYAIANELIKFDKLIEKGKEVGLLSQEEIELWYKEINTINDSIGFNVGINMVVIDGVKK